MDQTTNPNMSNNKCTCAHHRVTPAAILVIGLAYLLMNFHVVTPVIFSWVLPVALIVIGGTKLFEHRCNCC